MNKKLRKTIALIGIVLLLIAIVPASMSLKDADDATKLLSIALALCLAANLLGDLLQIGVVKSLDEKMEKEEEKNDGKKNE